MTLTEKIDRLMLLKGDNRNTLSKNAGIPYSTIANLYKLGFDNIKLSTLQKLADYFGVTLDFLARDIDPAAFPLTDHEKELVELFRQLNAQGQSVLLKNARAYAQDPDYQAAPPAASVS
jgi:transcriptional regulator with XRE-family HTH domain